MRTPIERVALFAAPSPQKTRPGAIWLSVACALASTAGIRVSGLTTYVPILIVLVSRATAPRYANGSLKSSGPSPTPWWEKPRSSERLTMSRLDAFGRVPTQNSFTVSLSSGLCPPGLGVRRHGQEVQMQPQELLRLLPLRPVPGVLDQHELRVGDPARQEAALVRR